jgi:hypothetical protein
VTRPLEDFVASPVSVIFPPPLREALERLAERNDRTLSERTLRHAGASFIPCRGVIPVLRRVTIKPVLSGLESRFGRCACFCVNPSSQAGNPLESA